LRYVAALAAPVKPLVFQSLIEPRATPSRNNGTEALSRKNVRIERIVSTSQYSPQLEARILAALKIPGRTEGVEEILRDLPADSPVRQRETFRRLVRLRALKNLKVIEADHAPMTGGMDFSAHGAHTRYKSGYTAVDKLSTGVAT
jgi:hypothetical protein